MMPTPMLYSPAIALVSSRACQSGSASALSWSNTRGLVCRWVNGIQVPPSCAVWPFPPSAGRGVALIRYIVLNRKAPKQQQKHCQERSQTQFSCFSSTPLTENTAAPSAPQSSRRGNGGKQTPEPLSVHRQVTDHASGLTVHRKHVILCRSSGYSASRPAAARTHRRCV